MTTLKVISAPSIPLDPEKIQTMADYDLALCLYRTWFEYDVARNAKSGIISKWDFIASSGSYKFAIDPRAKWSDGSKLTSSQLIDNLKRFIKIKSSYGLAIDAIIDLKNVIIEDSSTFIIPIKNKKPSAAFFQRMGSIFLAITHPNDWDKNYKLVSNNITIGPYNFNKTLIDEFELSINNNDFLSDEKRAKKIIFKLDEKNQDLKDFLNGDTFNNIIQTNTLIPKELYNKILIQKLPYWTRAYDRVSYLSPIKEFDKNSQKLRNLVIAMGNKFQSSKPDVSENVKLAYSLQPKGYPLNDKINYKDAESNIESFPDQVSILAVEGYQYEIQKKIIESLISSINPNIKISWIVKPNLQNFISELNNNSPYDLNLSSFGVADPEAATWISLVLNKQAPFVEISKKDLEELNSILNKHLTPADEVKNLRTLLTKIGERGSYLPLFHFSTMSIAKPGISFENIKELDETVDYSKLILK